MLNSFFSNVKFEIKNPIYVIINEYDHFANELLSFHPEPFLNIISKTVVKDLDALDINNLMDTLQSNYNGYLFAEEI